MIGYSFGYDESVLEGQFTSKERDAETGLDFFGARYMSSAEGKFTSPDPIHFLPQRLLNPVNKTHSSRQWIDMLVILAQGVVEYGMQFPGDQEMSGFLPPSHNVG